MRSSMRRRKREEASRADPSGAKRWGQCITFTGFASLDPEEEEEESQEEEQREESSGQPRKSERGK